jgi:putative salt-induced outer membrane protein YdiY
MEANKVIFRTDYAGEMKIDWHQVESLSADKKIKVVFDDSTALEGQILPLEAGKMKLQTEKLEEPSVFNLADVKAINPTFRPPIKITARVNAGMELERGNSDTDDYEIDASFQARTKKSRYRLGGEYSEEKTEGNLTSKDWTVFANYNYFFTKKWFGYVRTKFEHDEFADLDLRSTLSAGPGYQIFESDELNLFLSAGPGYIDENFIVASDNSFGAMLWELNYDQYFFDNLFQLFHQNDGYLSLKDSSDWIINTRQGIRFPLYRGLTATLQYTYEYESKPSPDASTDYDSTLNLLLGYEFKN